MDAKPRRIRSIAEARELVAAWKASGQNKEAWCRTQGILRSALLSCLYRVEALDRPPEKSGFIEVRPAAAPAEHGAPPSSLVLELGSDLRLLGLDNAGAIAVLRALRQERP